MTRDSNLSMQRRVEALESRLAATQRALDSQAQRARMWAWPRDTWLGRTTSSSYSNYPTEGDTFQVKLLSSHFTAAEGTRGVTENERGTVVVARTWPAKYLPRDTEVVVKRMRGIGPDGSGEWWIETPATGTQTDPIVQPMRATLGRDRNNYQTGQLAVSLASPGGGLWVSEVVAPGIYGLPTLFSGGAGNKNQPWLTCLRAGRYYLACETKWGLYSMDEAYSAPNWNQIVTVPGGGSWTLGPWPFSVWTEIGVNGNVSPWEGQPEGVFANFGASSQMLQFGGTQGVSYMTHHGHETVELAVGDTLSAVVGWSLQHPTSSALFFPGAFLKWVELTAIYCGDADNI